MRSTTQLLHLHIMANSKSVVAQLPYAMAACRKPPSLGSEETRATESECSPSDTIGLYHQLSGQVDSPILFGWWPRSSNWSRTEIVERTSRALPAVRPLLDFVALPLLPEIESLWRCWSQEHGLLPQQAVWFFPCLECQTSDDPSLRACKEVLQKIAGVKDLVFYPMYCTGAISAEAEHHSVQIIGDVQDHKLMPLSQAKSWMHPSISGARGSSCMREVLSGLGGRVRGPRGYVADNVGELQTAWKQLQQECPLGTKFVLKPSGGSGGSGIVVDAKESDLNAFRFASFKSSAILEEMVIGMTVPQSPTLYMIGDMPCGPLADQELGEDCTTNLGNILPSVLQQDLFSACVEAAQEINKTWHLTSNWGLDFVVDKGGCAVIVDINMGRPNGNFACHLWLCRSLQYQAMYTGAWMLPESGPSIEEIYDSLRSAKLLWNGTQGIIVYQYVPGSPSSYAIASEDGLDGVERIRICLSETLFQDHGIIV
jgi:hypothetical protein